VSSSGSAIVVGVDDEGQSSAALLWAAAEARRRDVVLRIVHAWQQFEGSPLPSQRSAPALDHDVLAEQEDVFDRVTAILERVAPDLVVTVEPVEGLRDRCWSTPRARRTCWSWAPRSPKGRSR